MAVRQESVCISLAAKLSTRWLLRGLRGFVVVENAHAIHVWSSVSTQTWHVDYSAEEQGSHVEAMHDVDEIHCYHQVIKARRRGHVLGMPRVVKCRSKLM